MSYDQPPRGRLARCSRPPTGHVPLRAILVRAGVVVAIYVAAKLMYLLRNIVVLMLVAGFVAVLLNPAVAKVQRRIPRRGLAVTIVTLLAVLVFIGLAAAFGVPLVNGTTHLADRMPSYVASAQHAAARLALVAAAWQPRPLAWLGSDASPGVQEVMSGDRAARLAAREVGQRDPAPLALHRRRVSGGAVRGS